MKMWVEFIVQTRLAGVRLGSGSGVLGPNLNLHLRVRFKQVANTNRNKMFGFGMFGSGANNVRCPKMTKFS
jgi:hypothetical protein